MNSKTLAAAADHIELFGFIGDEYYKTLYEDADGNEANPLELTGAHRRRDPRKCPVCPRGAIAVVCGEHPAFVDDEENEGGQHPAIFGAEKALVTYLLDEMHWRAPDGAFYYAAMSDRAPELIEVWAGRDRTQDEVLATMRAAAEYERKAGR